MKNTKPEENNLPIIARRIRTLRLSKDLTQEQFGQLFGIVKATVSSYETGNSVPDDNIKRSICHFFNVSTDYLLGTSDYPTKAPITEEDLKVALFGGAEYASAENWKKVQEYVEFLKTFKMNIEEEKK